MIICHRYKFIFIKTKKTAGTSLEIALSKFCDAADIITPLSSPDEALRRESGFQGPANFMVPAGNHSPEDWLSLWFQGRKPRYYNHIPAWRVKRRLDPEIWNSYFKFCFERNPWDKAISSYYFFTRDQNPKPTLEEFLRQERPQNISNAYLYMIGDRLTVDYVARYENLQTELDFLAERLGLPGKIDLPRAKGDIRTDHRPYQEVIGEPERKLITKICAREIREFNYCF
jgi:hypothetical protein